MSAEDDGERESEDDLPDPDAPPEADDPPMPKPESAAAAAEELRIQLAAMKKRLASREAEAQGLAQELAARNLEMERREKRQATPIRSPFPPKRQKTDIVDFEGFNMASGLILKRIRRMCRM